MARKRKNIKPEPSVSISDPPDPKQAANTNAFKETERIVNTESISIKEKVALLAYSYWERRGMPGGSPEEDWYRAEKEVLDQLGISSRKAD